MRIRAIFALPAMLVASPLAAQDVAPALDPTTMIGYAGTVAAGQYAQRDFGRQLSRTRSQPRAPAANAAALAARTSYRPDPAVRQQVYARAVATIQKASPEDAAQLRTKLANGTLRAAATKYLSGYGMSPNNVVDTTALYLASAWFASRASAGDPPPAQMKGLRRQVALTFATMPRLMGASNAAKQELAEANIIQSVIAGSLANQAASDPKIAGSVRASVVRAVRDMYQLDLTQLNLTAQGLR